jgi:hypothetical protein
MPITGTESVLKQLLHDNIKTELQGVGAGTILRDDWLEAFCKAVAESIIPHLVANVEVNPGQTVAPGSFEDGMHMPVTGEGVVDSPGTIS